VHFARAIAFVDAGLPDLDTLYHALPQGLQVVWLDAGQNGIETLCQKLALEQKLDAIHLITHGAPGRIFIGNQTLSQSNLDQHQEFLAQIQRTLGDQGEWLIYGCDVAQEQVGQAFIDSLPSHRCQNRRRQP
jgi:hypothetical protein